MKKFIYFITMALTLLSCSRSTKSSDGQKKERSTTDTIIMPIVNQLPSPTHPGKLFTLSDAEKLLGEPAHLNDSASTTKGEDSHHIDSISIIKNDAWRYSCSYIANSMDSKTGKTGIVYFVFEQYPHVSSAKKVYSFYKRANKNGKGFKELHDMGDEAWFGNSPLFVYVRKGDKLFVMKVNKMTSKTSPSDEFIRVAHKITGAL